MCDPISLGMLLLSGYGAVQADNARNEARADANKAQKEQEEMMRRQEEERVQKEKETAEKQRREEALRFGLTKTMVTSPFGDMTSPVTNKKTLLGQ